MPMDEIIVRLARTTASLPRLRVLSLLSGYPEMHATAIATALVMAPNTLSAHLRDLSTAGLVLRRKSGTWCYYRSGSPYRDHTLSGRLSAWLRSTLPASQAQTHDPGLHEVRDHEAEAVARLHRTVFEAATAFTDLRRVQILRRLMAGGRGTADDLVDALHLSPQALSRHMLKLIRRGYVRARRGANRALIYEATPRGRTPVHGQMLRLFQRAWEPSSLTS
jgi:DNA-binding transcriptional ArsR family regulator